VTALGYPAPGACANRDVSVKGGAFGPYRAGGGRDRRAARLGSAASGSLKTDFVGVHGGGTVYCQKRADSLESLLETIASGKKNRNKLHIRRPLDGIQNR